MADAPLARALRLVLRDDLEAWQATEAMVQALVRRPHDVAVVTAHQQALEELVAESGPGLVPWPTPRPGAGARVGSHRPPDGGALRDRSLATASFRGRPVVATKNEVTAACRR